MLFRSPLCDTARVPVILLCVLVVFSCGFGCPIPRKDPESMGEAGRKFTASGQYAEAIDCLSGAMQSPQYASLPAQSRSTMHEALAQALVQTGNFGPAGDHCQEALRLTTSPPAVMPLFICGVALHQSDKLDEAKAVYERALKVDTNFPELWLNYGSLLAATHAQEAIVAVNNALALRPDFFNAMKTLLWVFETNPSLSKDHKGDHLSDLAGKSIRHMLAVSDISLEVFYSVARQFTERKEFLVAQRVLVLVLRLRPDAGVYFNLGNMFIEQGKFQHAIKAFDSVGHTDAVERGSAMAQIAQVYSNNLGDRANAMRYFELAVKLSPDVPEPYVNLGSLLQSAGRIDEAIEVLQKSTTLSRVVSQSFSNLANILAEVKGKKEEAIAIARKGVELDPTSGHAHNVLGVILRHAGLTEEALAVLRRGMTVSGVLHEECALNLIEIYFRVLTKYDETREVLKEAIALNPNSGQLRCYRIKFNAEMCEYDTMEEDLLLVEQFLRHQFNAGQLPCMNVFDLGMYAFSAELFIDGTKYMAKQRDDEALKAIAANNLRFSYPKQLTANRLRIGYVSSDMNFLHPLGYLVQNVFAMHNRKRFEIYCYNTMPGDGGPIESVVRSGMDHWLELAGKSDADIASHINRDGIHILIDMLGWSGRRENFVIVGTQPAPVQILLGVAHAGPHGGKAVHAFHTDRVCSPVEFRAHYAEKFIYVPMSYQPNDHRQSYPEVLSGVAMSRRELGLPENAIVLASFNKFRKLDFRAFFTWVRVLKRVPNTVLWLLRDPAAAESGLREHFRRAGLSQDRLIFCDFMPFKKHFTRIPAADIVVDSIIGMTGHTTTADCLWAGVPVVTQADLKMFTRVSAALIKAVGESVYGDSPELDREGRLAEAMMVAPTYQEFEDRIVYLATHPKALARLKEIIRKRRGEANLFHTRKWVAHLERSLGMLWDAHTSDGRIGHSIVSAARFR